MRGRERLRLGFICIVVSIRECFFFLFLCLVMMLLNFFSLLLFFLFGSSTQMDGNRPGEGPVPFTYSAEAFPLYIRDVGMSFATSTTWLFNFIVALTFPRLLTAFKPQGAFGWYAGWNLIGWVLILLFVPETKALSLEELDQVFNVPTTKQVAYGVKSLVHSLDKYILARGKDVPELLPPYQAHFSTADVEVTAAAAEKSREFV